MVQLKCIALCDNPTRRGCFNSCMVQLKWGTQDRKSSNKCRFNSCMVQLKYSDTVMQFLELSVLIPVWCN